MRAREDCRFLSSPVGCLTRRRAPCGRSARVAPWPVGRPTGDAWLGPPGLGVRYPRRSATASHPARAGRSGCAPFVGMRWGKDGREKEACLGFYSFNGHAPSSRMAVRPIRDRGDIVQTLGAIPALRCAPAGMTAWVWGDPVASFFVPSSRTALGPIRDRANIGERSRLSAAPAAMTISVARLNLRLSGNDDRHGRRHSEYYRRERRVESDIRK